MGRIYIDGKFVGTHKDIVALRESLIAKRRKNALPKSTNIAYIKDRDELIINLGSGRARRPLVVVENGKSKLTDDILEKIEKKEMSWQDAIDNNIIEYLDAEEEENTFIALKKEEITKEHTHVELDSLLILGITASLLPYPEKNRGDRLNYGARMVVQSTGIPYENYHLRDDTTGQLLVYPQVPMAQTQTTTASGLSHHPAGHNLVVALMPFYGYNIEDAIIVNKASLDRGLGRSFFFRTYNTEARRYWGGQEDEIGLPEASIRGFKSDEEYADLGPEGIVMPETFVGGNGVLVGKTSPLRFLGVQKEIRMGMNNKRENSLTVKKGEEGTVEKVIFSEDGEGNRLIKVTVREHKVPEVGDKIASRHGQKGVVGLVVPEEDMPFTASGVTPDIIINPHAIPSRMTVGQLLEIVAGKAGAMAGTTVDATAFKTSEKAIRALLKKSGFKDDGKETLYNGITGEKIESQILIGIGYYQRLYHVVSHKMHARSRGPVALLTKQPTEGRSKEGGLRFGEMEKDCLVAHGAAATLKERFGSDKTTIKICKKCGITAINDKIKGKISCPLCKGSEVVDVDMNYAFKLLLDELKCMYVYPQIVAEKD